MSKVPSRGELELCGVSVSTSGVELSEAMSSVWLGAHKGANSNRFRGNVGKDIKGMSGDKVRKVRDYGNAVPGIGSLIRGSVNGRGGMRKSRGRVRT